MSNKFTGTLLCVVLAGWSSGSSAAAPGLKDGEWGTRYRMELLGMPFPMPPLTVNKSACLDQNNYIPSIAQDGQDCTVSDTRVSGNTVNWNLNCRTREGRIDGQGKLTYKAERYDGVVNATLVSTDNSRAPVHYRYTLEGERLGACGK
jgi:hypothetical protein